MIMKCLQISTVYKLKGGQDNTGFGAKLRGREGAQRAMAAEADKHFAIRRASKDVLTKDEDSQVLCLWGVGTGKSRLLAAGLEAHKTYCTNADLTALLKDENRCLRILISFNTSTTFSAAESTSANKLICRRLIKEVTGISWGEALTLNLGAELTVSHCMEAIVRLHREARGLRSDDHVFVFLGVDEVNQITSQTYTNGIEIVKDITRSLRTLRTLPGMFVATAMAGTHLMDINESVLGSGIRPVMLPYEPLSKADVDLILREDAGVSEEYMQNPHFQRVIDSAFPVLRPLGELVSQLPAQYDANSVHHGDQVVSTYFERKTGKLEAAERDYLLLAALTGRIFTGEALGRKLLHGSTTSLDDLQNRGIIQIVSLDARDHQICLPLCQAENWSRSIDESSAVLLGARDLLQNARRAAEDFSSFEKFTARFFSMKLARLRGTGSTTFTMAQLLPSAQVTTDLANKQFRIPADCPLVPLGDIICLDSQGRFPSDKCERAPHLYQHLQDGGLIVNAPGAGVDIIAFLECMDSNGIQWLPGGLAICPKKTALGQQTDLSLSDVNGDYEKATSAFEELQQPHNKRSCTVIHFTNRALTIKDKDADAGKKTKLTYERKVELFVEGRTSSVIVDQQSIGRIVGPVLSHLVTRPVRRTFSTLSVARVAVAGVRRLLK